MRGRRWCAWLGDLVREHGAGVVVLSGSLPVGLPADAYARLVDVAHAHGARVVVDADGAALRDAVTAGPEVVKPNRHELLSATGCTDVAAGVAALRALGARDVVVSDGAEGLLLFPRTAARCGPGCRSRCRATRPVPVTRWSRRSPPAWRRATVAGGGQRRAVAWSAAAVLQPVAGEIDPDDASAWQSAGADGGDR